MRYTFIRQGNDRGWVETWDGKVALASQNFKWAMYENISTVLDWSVGKFRTRIEENKEYKHNQQAFEAGLQYKLMLRRQNAHMHWRVKASGRREENE